MSAIPETSNRPFVVESTQGLEGLIETQCHDLAQYILGSSHKTGTGRQRR